MKVEINKKVYHTPNHLNELKYKDYAKVLDILESSNDRIILKKRITEYLLRLKTDFWDTLKMNWIENDDAFFADVHNICSVADFCFEKIVKDEKEYITKAENRTKPPFFSHKKHYAPHSKLSSITFMEWAYLDTFYTQYQKEPSIELYHKIIAILYRLKTQGKTTNKIDARMSLNIYYTSIDHHIKTIAKWDNHRKMTAFHFFISSRRAIIKMYPNFFKENTNKTLDSNLTNYAHLMTDLAGEKFGTIDLVQEQNVHTVLTYLDLFVQREAERKFNARFK